MPDNRDSVSARVNSNPAIVSGISRPSAKMSQEGVDLDELAFGAVLEIETGHTTYRLENRGEGSVLLSGHPRYCPEPTMVKVQSRFLGEGLKMVFLPPDHGVVRTSPVERIRRLQSPN